MPATDADAGQLTAMVLPSARARLQEERRSLPSATGADVLIRVHACAVCRTDLHLQDGELPQARYPVVPGHQAIGEVLQAGPQSVVAAGERVGATWLAWACGVCEFCRSGRENLCDRAQFHGCQRDGGFATHMIADSRFCLPLGRALDAERAAPLLCAGLIGFRSLRMAGDARTIGIYGFGSAAHVITQVAAFEGRRVLAFTSPGDTTAQAFARQLGAAWAGGSDLPSPEPLDAALIFAPVGALVPRALKAIKKGGAVICGGIHMSDIPGFPYADLWGERQLRSVANLTRRDGMEFMKVAAAARIETRVRVFPLAAANEALHALRDGTISGTAVLDCR